MGDSGPSLQQPSVSFCPRGKSLCGRCPMLTQPMIPPTRPLPSPTAAHISSLLADIPSCPSCHSAADPNFGCSRRRVTASLTQCCAQSGQCPAGSPSSARSKCLKSRGPSPLTVPDFFICCLPIFVVRQIPNDWSFQCVVSVTRPSQLSQQKVFRVYLQSVAELQSQGTRARGLVPKNRP